MSVNLPQKRSHQHTMSFGTTPEKLLVESPEGDSVNILNDSVDDQNNAYDDFEFSHVEQTQNQNYTKQLSQIKKSKNTGRKAMKKNKMHDSMDFMNNSDTVLSKFEKRMSIDDNSIVSDRSKKNNSSEKGARSHRSM